ncbi:MAG: hypothetical protein FWE40_04775 [Oscillospiraceae bacterium]|nr:hypothetical protein [Oscillospiraceae bacterium]
MDNLTIEQYKQEMLRQASRARAFDPPAAVPLEEPVMAHDFGEPDLPAIVHMPSNEMMEDSYTQPDPFFDTTIEAEDIVPFVQEESDDNGMFLAAETQPPAPAAMPQPTLQPEPEPMFEPQFEVQAEAFADLPAPLPQAMPDAGVISDEEWFGMSGAAAQPTVAYVDEPEELDAEQLDEIEHFPPGNAALEANETVTEYYEMPSPVFSSLAEFRANNPAKGEILVHVTDHGSPAAGARVQITKQIGGKTYRFYDGYAGRNGSVGPIELPAPRKEAAYHETTIPYALYDITVTHARERQHLQNVPMFADTAGEQVVRMQNDIPINEAVYVK